MLQRRAFRRARGNGSPGKILRSSQNRVLDRCRRPTSRAALVRRARRPGRGRDTFRRKTGNETTSGSRGTLDFQRGIVAGERVLHNGKPESRAAGFPRAAAVHPVEAFGEAWNMLGGN